jgi:hypothetical protein
MKDNKQIQSFRDFNENLNSGTLDKLSSKSDEHDNYYLNDIGYTNFDDYLKDTANFYGFEIRIF